MVRFLYQKNLLDSQDCSWMTMESGIVDLRWKEEKPLSLQPSRTIPQNWHNLDPFPYILEGFERDQLASVSFYEGVNKIFKSVCRETSPSSRAVMEEIIWKNIFFETWKLVVDRIFKTMSSLCFIEMGTKKDGSYLIKTDKWHPLEILTTLR